MRRIVSFMTPIYNFRISGLERLQGRRSQAAVCGVPVHCHCSFRQAAFQNCFSWRQVTVHHVRRVHMATAASSIHGTQPASEFFAPLSTSFASLGLSEELLEAVSRAGFEQPAHVQSVAIPTALAGDDLVLAAETGSGKTLAYLLPVIQSLRRRQQQMQLERPDAPSWFRHCAVVLCPNMALCEQVASSASRLTSTDGVPLANCAVVSANQPPGQQPIDIVVSTPAALVNMLQDFGQAYGKEWTPEAMSQRVRHLVADEADLLVSNPTYWDPLCKFLDLLRTGERSYTGRAISTITGMTLHEFQDLKRHIKMAAFRDGVSGMLAAGWEPPEGMSAEQSPEQIALIPDDIRVGGAHRCRSYLFVAATVPREGGKSVQADLKKRFPNMKWLEGRRLHIADKNVEHTWVKLQRAEDVGPTVIAALEQDRAVRERIGHVLVFCKDVQSATALHATLESVGLPVLMYHKKVSRDNRSRALETMKQEEGWIMVSTDAAARGLDFPNINHVMQADFAENASEFLHRVGRTGRAGRSGKVTSLYMEDRAELAETIKQAVEDGGSVEGVFSRNRSFSQKFKRYGKYVPRGERG